MNLEYFKFPWKIRYENYIFCSTFCQNSQRNQKKEQYLGFTSAKFNGLGFHPNTSTVFSHFPMW